MMRPGSNVFIHLKHSSQVSPIVNFDTSETLSDILEIESIGAERTNKHKSKLEKHNYTWIHALLGVDNLV